MKKSDLIIDLVSMRRSGEFHTDELLNNIGVSHGRSIQMPLVNCTIYLDCEYCPSSLPEFVKPYFYDSHRFWD